jgi:dihydropteroate synthase
MIAPASRPSTSPPAIVLAWHCGRFQIDLSRPRIMGVVNVTPDSFSDGGRFLDLQDAIAHAHRLIEEGADIIDVGGESTRPGAAAVEAAEELDRVLPVLRALRDARVPIAIDTTKAEVMRAAIAEGAAIVNDVMALRLTGALLTVAESDAGVCLMHMLGQPRTMQAAPSYGDVVHDVRQFLSERIDAATQGGIASERIAIDPGFGFGKTREHNLALLRSLERFGDLGVPVLVGLSRKSTLGAITGRSATERMAASVAAALLAVQHGARIVRVHDVAATRDALAVLAAVQGSRE